MLLTELTGYHAAKEMSLRGLLKKLQADGAYTVKNGSFAVVLVPPDKPYVFRVWTKDLGYAEFLDYISHHGSKYLARIIGKVHTLPIFFKQPEHQEQDSFQVARIEKLEPLTSHLAIQVIGECYNIIKNVIKPSMMKKLTVGDLIDRIAGSDFEDDDAADDPKVEFIKDRIEFFEAYVATAKWAASRGLMSDMHEGNVMLRSTGGMVITDPFAKWPEVKIPQPLAHQLVDA